MRLGGEAKGPVTAFVTIQRNAMIIIIADNNDALSMCQSLQVNLLV